MEQRTNSRVSGDEIDLRELASSVWSCRRLVIICTLAATLFATVYAFVIAKPSFTSSALLVPTERAPTDKMSAAASLLGKSSMDNSDRDLYQNLLKSRTVLHKLLLTTVSNHSDTANGRTESIYMILQIDTTNHLSIEKTLNRLAKRIEVGSKDGETGSILEIKVSASSAWLAQSMCSNLLAIGQEEIRLVSNDRFNIILERLSVAVAQAKAEWDTTTTILANYTNENRSSLLPQKILERTRLEVEKSAKEQKYLSVRHEYEAQQIAMIKTTPPMMILDPATLPAQKSKPRRILIVAFGLFSGAFLSIMGVLVHKTFYSPPST